MFPFDEKPVFVTVKLDQLDEREVPIAADLRDVMTGEIVSGMLERSTYASDAGMLYELPTVVVRPRQRADLPRIVRLAAEKNTPIHPRGAGTQMLGGAIGDGMVIDTSRFLNRIEWAAPNIVRVDAGVRLYQLKDWLISQQRKLEFSPWNHDLGTIGGLLAGNVIEPQVKRRSALAEMVRQMTVVLVDGTRLTLRVGQHEQAVQLEPLTGKGSSGSTISPPEWFDRIQQLQRAIASRRMRFRVSNQAIGRVFRDMICVASATPAYGICQICLSAVKDTGVDRTGRSGTPRDTGTSSVCGRVLFKHGVGEHRLAAVTGARSFGRGH